MSQNMTPLFEKGHVVFICTSRELHLGLCTLQILNKCGFNELMNE